MKRTPKHPFRKNSRIARGLLAALALFLFTADRPPGAAFAAGPAAQDTDPYADTHRFSLNIKEADLHEVLLLITRDSPYSLVMEPGAGGILPAIDLKNVTIAEALSSILPGMGLEYRLEGGLLSVGKPRLQTRLFYLNYIAASRSGTRDMRLTSRSEVGGSDSGIMGSGQSGSGSGSGGGSSAENESTLVTENNSRVWDDLQLGLRNIVFPEIPETDTAQMSESGPSTTALRDPLGRRLLINPHAGVIMIHAEPDALKEADSYIQAVEVSSQRQVLIEARVVEVTLSKDHQLGINWSAILNPTSGFSGLLPDANGVVGPSFGLSTGSVVNQNVNPSVGRVQYGISNGRVGMVIDALSRQGQLRVLSSPHVSTLNNQKAVIRVVREEVFFTQTSLVSQSVGPTITTANVENQIVPIGVVLDIIPQIALNGEITLSINPSISELVEIRTFASEDGNAVSTQPVIDRRDLDTVAKVLSGETVLIAGILRERKGQDLRGVPWLMDIPFLGNMFRRTEQSLERTELVIFITPTIVSGGNIKEITAEKNRSLEELAPGFRLGTVEPVREGVQGEMGSRRPQSPDAP